VIRGHGFRQEGALRRQLERRTEPEVWNTGTLH